MHCPRALPLHFSLHENNKTLITSKLKTPQMEGYFGIFSTTGKQSIFVNNNSKTLLRAFTAPLGFEPTFSPSCPDFKEGGELGTGMQKATQNK